MTSVVFSVVLALVGFSLLLIARRRGPATAKVVKSGKKGDGREVAVISGGRAGLLLGGAFSLLLAAVVILAAMFTLVRAVEVGVPVTFGQVGEPLRPGVHFVAPWTSVETYPTRPLTVETNVTARTAEGGQVQVRVANRWAVQPDQARTLYFLARTGDEERISAEVVEKSLAQAVGVAYSRMTNVDAANDRENPPKAIQEELQELLRPYGITSNAVLLRSVEPDDRTAAAIANFAAQQQATRIAREAAATAQQEAARRIIEAEGLKKAAEQIPNLNAAQVQALCAQAWERMQAEAIKARQPLYTGPCSSGQTPVIASPGGND